MSDPGSDDRAARPLVGGRLLAEITNRIVAFMRQRPDGFADLDDAAAQVAEYLPQRARPRDPSGLLQNLRLRQINLGVGAVFELHAFL